MRQIRDVVGTLLAASTLLLTLTACATTTTGSGVGQSTSEACGLVTQIPDEIDSDRDNLLSVAGETPDLTVDDIETALQPVRDRLAKAEAQLENPDVTDAFTQYSSEVVAWVDLVVAEASSGQGGQEMGQDEINEYTADLVEQESRIDTAKDDLFLLCDV